jgi:hypothetical protein
MDDIIQTLIYEFGVKEFYGTNRILTEQSKFQTNNNFKPLLKEMLSEIPKMKSHFNYHMYGKRECDHIYITRRHKVDKKLSFRTRNAFGENANELLSKIHLNVLIRPTEDYHGFSGEGFVPKNVSCFEKFIQMIELNESNKKFIRIRIEFNHKYGKDKDLKRIIVEKRLFSERKFGYIDCFF